MMMRGKQEKKQNREKKPKRLRRWIAFDGFECKGAEEYLQEMAEKGWLLDEVNGSTGIYYFVPIEPKKLRYSVKVFDGASLYDLSPSETSLTYAEYCEKAGWHFVGSMNRLHFFYEEQPGAVDIETDSALELKAVVKYAMIRNAFIWFLIPLFFIENLTNYSFLRLMTHYTSLVNLGFTAIVFLVGLFRLISFLIWYIPNKRRVADGKRILYKGRASLRKNNYSALFLLISILLGLLVICVSGGPIATLVICLTLIGIIGFAVGLTIILRKLKTSGKMNLVICIISGIVLSVIIIVYIIVAVIVVFNFVNRGTVYYKTFSDGNIINITAYQDDVPVTTDDLAITGSGVLSNEKDENHTIFAADMHYDSNYENIVPEDTESVGISYEIFTSPYTWIMGKYENEKLYHSRLDFPQKWTEAGATSWNAKAVYCRHDEVDESHSVVGVRYLVIYPNAVLDFSADKKDLSQKDIKLICDKLHKEISAIPASEEK